MDNQDKETFYIVRAESEDAKKDFEQFIYDFKRWYGVDLISNDKNEYTISSNVGYSSSIKLVNAPEGLNKYAIVIEFKTFKQDRITFQHLRAFIATLAISYMVFDPVRKFFLPKNFDLIYLEKNNTAIGEYNLKVKKALEKYGLEPLFYLTISEIFYALAKDGSVHLINKFLLDYLINNEVSETKLDELHYRVAQNIKRYVQLENQGLVPRKFYKFLNKSAKVINYSDFDIENPGRKVFIKPLILELDDQKNDFYLLGGDGAKMLFMSKIEKGENLHRSILRILKKDLDIADDYVGAIVNEAVEFDLDKEGKITPRLVVLIFVEKITRNRDKVVQKAQTGWTSLGKTSHLDKKNTPSISDWF